MKTVLILSVLWSITSYANSEFSIVVQGKFPGYRAKVKGDFETKAVKKCSNLNKATKLIEEPTFIEDPNDAVGGEYRAKYACIEKEGHIEDFAHKTVSSSKLFNHVDAFRECTKKIGGIAVFRKSDTIIWSEEIFDHYGRQFYTFTFGVAQYGCIIYQ